MAVKRYGAELILELQDYRRKLTQEVPTITKKGADAAALAFAKSQQRIYELDIKEKIKTEKAKERAQIQAAERAARATEAAQVKAAQDVDRALSKLRDDQQREAKGADLFNVEKELERLDELESEMRRLNKLTAESVDLLNQRRDAARRGLASRVGAGAGGDGPKAIQRTAAAADKAEDSLRRFEDRAGEADSIIAALGGALGQLDPRLETIARVGADAAGGIEAVARAGREGTQVARLVGVGFGAASVAAGTLAVANEVLERRLQAAEDAQRGASNEADRAARIYGGLSETIDQVAREYAVLVDGQDELALSLQEQTTRIEDQSRVASQAIIQRIKALKAERDAVGVGVRVTEESVKRREEVVRLIGVEEAKLAALNARTQTAIDQAQDVALAKAEERQGRSTNATAIDAEASALARLSEQQRAGDALRARMLANIMAEQEAHDQLRAIIDAANSDQLDQFQRIDAARSEQLAQLDALIEKGAQASEVQAAADAIEARAARDKIAATDELKARREEEDAAEEETLKARADRIAEYQRQSAENAIEAVAISSGQLGKVLTDGGRKGFQALMVLEKAAAARQLLIAAKVAFGKSLAVVPAPVGIPAAIANAALVAAQSGAIEQVASSFDIGGTVRGGMVQRQSDSVPARLLPGESVLNSTATAALGEDGVNRLNRGDGAQPRSTVAPAPWLHFGRFWESEIQGYGRVSSQVDNRISLGEYVGKR